jgi:hypothetical protein
MLDCFLPGLKTLAAYLEELDGTEGRGSRIEECGLGIVGAAIVNLRSSILDQLVHLAREQVEKPGTDIKSSALAAYHEALSLHQASVGASACRAERLGINRSKTPPLPILHSGCSIGIQNVPFIQHSLRYLFD